MSNQSSQPQAASTSSEMPFDAPAERLESSLASHLEEGHAVPSFPHLAPEIRAELLRALDRMSADDQREVLARMGPMSVEELIGLALNPNPSRKEPPRPQPTTYVVRRGDSLSKIAREHGLGLRAVIDANPQIQNPNLIHPEQVINLPI